VLNRVTEVTLPDVTREQALAAAQVLAHGDASSKFTAALLELHAQRVSQVDRQKEIAHRFTAAHPGIRVTSVRALAQDVHDLDGLREIGDLLSTP